MSTLRVNLLNLNDAANAAVSIANSWNVAVVSGGQTRLHVNYDGNIGMGTTSPSYRVHMVTSGNSAYVASADGSGTTISGVNGSGLGVYGTFSATDTAIFSNSLERVRVAATGNVGIGTSTPGYKLDVAGTINTANLLVNGVVPVSIPTGAVVNYASTTAPTGGYLACDGSIYSRSSYGALANVIGTPPMLSSYTAELANNTIYFNPNVLGVANGVAFISSPIFATQLYTSTDGTTWTSRTGRFLSTSTQYNINNNVVANVAGGFWITSNGAGTNVLTNAPAVTPSIVSTSTDLVTWTSRTISLSGQTGTAPSSASYFLGTYFGGIAGGGTSNRLVVLFNRWSSGCCTPNSGYIANTATSDDAGATWSYSNNIPVANASIQFSAISSTNAGFVVVRGNSAYFSANGQYWQDITANLCSAIGVSTGLASNGAVLFYNVFQANNQFIIPAYNNKFIVTTPSGNGANGNWTVITPEGLPLYTYSTYTATALIPLTNQFSGTSAPAATNFSRIVNNGQGFVMNFGGQIMFSQDLKYWFRKIDPNYAQTGDGGGLLGVIGNKFIMWINGNKTLVSFTANASYTAATQFPVPKYSSSVQAQQFNFDGVPATPLIPYIKT